MGKNRRSRSNSSTKYNSRSSEKKHRRHSRSNSSITSQESTKRHKRRHKHRHNKHKHRSSSSRSSSFASSSNEDNRRRHRKQKKREQFESQVTEGYKLYQERRRQRKLEEEKKGPVVQQEQESIECRKLDLNDFPHYKRKLVIQNIPVEESREEIMNYFFTILSQVSSEQYSKNPIMAVSRMQRVGNVVTLDFRKREEADVCLNLDGTEYKTGYKMKIQRVKRFIEEWNREMDKAPVKKGSHFHEGQAIEKKKEDEAGVDPRIYMGNIPPTMKDDEVRQLCESFGRLKSFNLVKDALNPDQNKGYAFFEYCDDRATDKAIKALNNIELKDKKLRVHKGGTSQKPVQSQSVQNIGSYKSVPDDKRLPLPLFAMTPSRVIQVLNMISKEDLFEEDEVVRVKDDLLQEMKQFGEIISVEVPRPDENGVCTVGVGKIFVKFNHIVAGKMARYKMSGRKYNGRTVVISFYPEHYFDIKEFSII